MKKNGKQELVARVARRGLLPTALFAMMLSSPGIILAQSTEPAAPAQSARPGAEPAAANQAPVVAAKPSAALAKAAESLEEESPKKGMQEGIKIHGHWTIEVRNPDGKVQSHTEFQNSLQGNGPLILANLLSGQVSSGGGWAIVLGNVNNSLSPCADASGAPSPCYIYAKPVLNSVCFPPNPNSCFPTLTISPNSPPTTTPTGGWVSPTSVTLQGTATASNSNAVVGYASTSLAMCVPTVAPTNCIGSFGGATLFSARQLDGIGTDPPPVPITAAGQTIAVTVQFSFQ